MDLNEIERELVAGARAVFIRSAELGGQVICLVADGVVLERDGCGRYRGCVVYTISEIDSLRRKRLTTSELRRYHLEKIAEQASISALDFGGEEPE